MTPKIDLGLRLIFNMNSFFCVNVFINLKRNYMKFITFKGVFARIIGTVMFFGSAFIITFV